MARDGDGGDWSVGSVVAGLYEVGQRLGSGGMGRVDLVRHLGWNQYLAVKSPHRHLWDGLAGTQTFVDEARLWVELPPHPHICACHYVRVLDGVPRVFAEYAGGGSVADALRHGSVDGLEEILDVAIQSARGLAAAHRAGVVHQDVKPGNLIRDGDGTIKVTDFGLARIAARRDTPPARRADMQDADDYEGESVLVSRRGMTPAYASPEQIHGASLGRRSDVWSWAVTVLELFLGGITWRLGLAAPSALNALGREPAPGRPVMPEAVAALLRLCLTEDPTERPAALDDVADELGQVYEGELGIPYPRSAVPEVTEIADGLNNRAVSLLDLGEAERAQRCWEQALRADPGHLEANYNHGLWRWRAGAITDQRLVAELATLHPDTTVQNYMCPICQEDIEDPDLLCETCGRSVAGPERDRRGAAAYHADDVARGRLAHLLGLVHLERGDTAAASEALREAVARAPDDPDVAAALNTAAAGHRSGREATLATLAGIVLAVTPDGGHALSTRDGDTVACWDLATGERRGELLAHGGVSSAAAMPGGRVALTVDAAGRVRVWDVSTGRGTTILDGPGWLAAGLATGIRAAVLGHVQGFGLAKLGTDARERVQIGRHDVEVCAVAATTGGRYVLTGDSDGTVGLFEMPDARPVRMLTGHVGQVEAVAITPDAAHGLSAGADGTVRYWDLGTGRCRRTLDGRVRSVALAPSGTQILTGDGDGTVRKTELAPGTEAPWAYSRPRAATELAGRSAEFHRLLHRARGLLETGEHARALAVLRDARATPGYARHHELRALWHQAGRDGQRTRLLDAHQSRVLTGHTDDVVAVALPPEGGHALTVGQEGHLQWWDLDSGEARQTGEGRRSWFHSAAVIPGRSHGLTGGILTEIWDLATGERQGTLGGPRGAVDMVAVTPDARLAVTGSRVGASLQCWELATGRCLLELAPPGGISSLAVSADGSRALTGTQGDHGAVRLWDLHTGDCLRTLDEPDATSVAMSGDGGHALTASRTGQVRYWDLATGRGLRKLGDRAGSLVALTPDGHHAVSAGWNRVKTCAVHCWEPGTGRHLASLTGHTDQIVSLALAPDASVILTGGRDRVARVWELDWDYELPDAKPVPSRKTDAP